MISSTVVVACRGAKRWFDLDAVRTPSTTKPQRRFSPNTNKTSKGLRQPLPESLRDERGIDGTGFTPPLDWHLDGHTTTPTFEPREGTQMLRYIVGDTRDVTATIDDASVDLIFTSPPFLALRSYLAADHPDKHREIGSEATPAAFLDVLLGLTAEWGRVLAPHGTLAVELGDTYSGSGGVGGDYNDDGWHEGQGKFRQSKSPGWPLPKSLALIPQLYAVALAYGINPLTGQPSPAGRWRVRNVVMWHRPNPPVGALGDKWRPASSAITVACRGAKRWFDLDAVRTEHQHGVDPATMGGNGYGYRNPQEKGNPTVSMPGNPAGAPPLDWHTDGDLGVGHIILSTQPYAGSHYATFPMDLPRKIIDCMCPRQVCRVCGVARERVTGDVKYVDRLGRVGGAPRINIGGDYVKGERNVSWSQHREVETLGWTDCGHDDYRPGTVFDPFVGTGTTLAAAQDLGRDGIGVDIDPDNAWLARERVGMFCTFEDFPSSPEVEDVASPLL